MGSAKLEPLIVIWTVVPCVPEFGVTKNNCGVGVVTVNGSALLGPPGVVTNRFRLPTGALAETVTLAVISDSFVTDTPLTEMPTGILTIVFPATKFPPANDTKTVWPCAAELGVSVVRKGGLMAKLCVLLVPPGVVTDTLTLCGVTPDTRVKVAVI
jgi:hypothetical protein